jgi:UDP-galactopyranose mutase
MVPIFSTLNPKKSGIISHSLPSGGPTTTTYNDPYYPIPREENRARYELYLKEVQKLNGTVIFAGRLAEYKYYDMDQAALRALSLFEKEVVSK